MADDKAAVVSKQKPKTVPGFPGLVVTEYDEKDIVDCYVCGKDFQSLDTVPHLRPKDDDDKVMPERVICHGCLPDYTAKYNARRNELKAQRQAEEQKAFEAEQAEHNERRLRAMNKKPDSFKLSDNP